MTRKQRRSTLIVTSLGVLGLAVGLVLFALSDSIVFFYSPSDVFEKQLQPGQRIRLGGLVEKGSVTHGEGTQVKFSVTDNARVIPVVFDKVLPDLFEEGQGVVTEGKMRADGIFHADTVMAKHDENYMPKEVADTLKKQGVWKEKKPEQSGGKTY